MAKATRVEKALIAAINEMVEDRAFGGHVAGVGGILAKWFRKYKIDGKTAEERKSDAAAG